MLHSLLFLFDFLIGNESSTFTKWLLAAIDHISWCNNLTCHKTSSNCRFNNNLDDKGAAKLPVILEVLSLSKLFASWSLQNWVWYKYWLYLVCVDFKWYRNSAAKCYFTKFCFLIWKPCFAPKMNLLSKDENLLTFDLGVVLAGSFFSKFLHLRR